MKGLIPFSLKSNLNYLVINTSIIHTNSRQFQCWWWDKLHPRPISTELGGRIQWCLWSQNPNVRSLWYLFVEATITALKRAWCGNDNRPWYVWVKYNIENTHIVNRYYCECTASLHLIYESNWTRSNYDCAHVKRKREPYKNCDWDR